MNEYLEPTAQEVADRAVEIAVAVHQALKALRTHDPLGDHTENELDERSIVTGAIIADALHEIDRSLWEAITNAIEHVADVTEGR